MSALPGRPRSITPSRCLTSAPRPSRPPASASSRRSSSWPSACGGSAVPKRRAPGRRGLYAAADWPGTADSRRRREDSRARDGGGRIRSGRNRHGKRGDSEPSFVLAVLPLAVVIVMNFLMSLVVLPRLDFSFLAEEVWGGTTIGAVAGIWSVVLALAAGTLTVVIVNYRRLPALRREHGCRRQSPRSCRS